MRQGFLHGLTSQGKGLERLTKGWGSNEYAREAGMGLSETLIVDASENPLLAPLPHPQLP